MPRLKDAEENKRKERRCGQRQARSHNPAASSASEIAVSSSEDMEQDGLPSPVSKRRAPFAVLEASESVAEEDAVDGPGQHVEKKRRLSVEQVKSLEKHFEQENKLEPERKLQLAKELGLQPRQVAVWFQNRRARWKTKQLEKDYDALKASLDALKGDYNSLLEEKQGLEAEVIRLNDLLCSGFKHNKTQQSLTVEITGAAADRGDQSKESESNSTGTTRKDCSSWDSDGSEIVDDNQINTPRPAIDSESGGRFSLHPSHQQEQQHHHQEERDDHRVLEDTDPLECHISHDEYAASAAMGYSSARIIPKLEDSGYDSTTAGGFLDLDDQGSLSWWDWS